MLERLIKKLRIKVSNIITRCILLGDAVEIDGQMFIQVEGLKDEILSDVEHRQQYGFRSRPPIGTRAILLAIGGDKSNATAILADSKEIEKLPAWEVGESRQFDDNGARHRIFDQKHESDGVTYLWKIDDDNKLEFVAGSFKLTVGGELYEFTSAKLQSTSADIVADSISLQTHIHSGSPTAPTGGVSNTGQPQ